MVVDDAVALALRGRSRTEVATFVASCAERMVQIFTGLCGDVSGRAGDMDVVVRLMEDLWNQEVPAESFRMAVSSLEGFQELEPSDEEIAEIADIYSFYSILALRYASLYRCAFDVEDALKCAHSCLTSMAQLDQNLAGADFFAQEVGCQRRAVSETYLTSLSGNVVAQLRESDRAIGRERVAAILSRLAQ
ncbi:hypothetical protein ACIBJE_29860 [Micromonospora sp. NPDC050187]|uniref:hypothetical protein n=1 Tax=Micromonospora sp. NPDC050187 TaxID=3364277 RepID=UPI0037885728